MGAVILQGAPSLCPNSGCRRSACAHTHTQGAPSPLIKTEAEAKCNTTWSFLSVSCDHGVEEEAGTYVADAGHGLVLHRVFAVLMAVLQSNTQTSCADTQ